MDNQNQSAKKPLANPYQKGAEKALAQAGEAHVSEAIQAGVPVDNILQQLQELSQRQVTAAPQSGGGLMSGMQGLVPAILKGLQGQGFNPMAPKTEPLGMDMASKVMTLQQSANKSLMDAEKHPLEKKKLEQETDPEFKVKQAKSEAQAKGSFLSANDLFTKFESDVQPFKVQRDAYDRILSVGKEPSAAGDLALVFGVMKLNDPMTGVREGEYANAQNSGSVPQRLIGLYNRVLSGKRLSDEQRTDFIKQSKNIYDSAERQYSKTRKEFTKLAIANQLEPDSLIRDLGLEEGSNESDKSSVLARLGLDPERYEVV